MNAKRFDSKVAKGYSDYLRGIFPNSEFLDEKILMKVIKKPKTSKYQYLTDTDKLKK